MARIALTRDDAQVLVEYFKCYVLADEGRELLDEHENTVIAALPRRIQQAIDSAPELALDKGIRVSLLSQTAKESDLDYPQTSHVRERMKNYLQELCATPAYQRDQEQWPDSNMIIQAFFHAVCYEDKLCSVSELSQSLIHSTKCYLELKRLLEKFPEDSEEFSCAIELYPWISDPMSCYFRGFIGENGKLNAISQYFNFLFFPEILPHTEYIKRRFQKYFDEKVEPKIKDGSLKLPCIVDLCIALPENGERESLFKITSYDASELDKILQHEFFGEEDKDLLLQGEKELQFRYWSNYVEPEVLCRYFSATDEYFMDEVVYEFVSHEPAKLNLVSTSYQWCPLL